MKSTMRVVFMIAAGFVALATSQTCNLGEFKVHESDCAMFYKCDFSGWVEFSCAPGTEFNPSINNCDWPHNVNCATSDSTASDTCSPLGSLKKHETECGRFYKCDNNGWVEFSCASGTVFNPSINNCDWPFNVDCSSDTTTSATPNDDECVANSAYEAVESDCGHFMACPNGVLTTFQCPKLVPLFNSDILECDYIYNVQCGARPVVCTEDDTGFGEDSECREFYVCKSNSWSLYVCPAPYRYNGTTCVAESEYYCASASSSTPATTTTTTTTTSTTTTIRPPCATSRCMNGGTCFNIGTSFWFCSCPAGFTGSDCGTPLATSTTSTTTTTTTTTTTPPTTTTLSVWGPWGDLMPGVCDKVCGGGLRDYTRTRQCLSAGGCTGESTEVIPGIPCNTAACPCTSTSCSGFTCTDVSATEYTCTCPTDRTGVNCETVTAPVNGAWSEWSQIAPNGDCSKGCGSGTRNYTRTRDCNNPAPSNGGLTCSGDAVEIFPVPCNTQACPTCDYPCPATGQIAYPNITDPASVVVCILGTLQNLECGPGETYSTQYNRCCIDVNNCL